MPMLVLCRSDRERGLRCLSQLAAGSKRDPADPCTNSKSNNGRGVWIEAEQRRPLDLLRARERASRDDASPIHNVGEGNVELVSEEAT